MLGYGCAQEEIKFIQSPECLCGLFMMEVMDANEAIIVRGAQQYSTTSGYAWSLGFQGPYEVAAASTHNSSLIAIDALDLRRSNQNQAEQYSPKLLMRELNKALAGFSCQGNRTISTGLWGCGVFGGHPQLKTLIQWCAASLVGKSLVLFTADDERLNGCQELLQLLFAQRVTVAELWRELSSCGMRLNVGCFEHISSVFSKVKTNESQSKS